MTILLLLAALVVAGVGVWMSRRWRVMGTSMMGLGGVALVAVVFLQVRQNFYPSEPKTPNRYEMAASTCLANCLLRDVAGQSGSVVLLFPQRRFMDADTEQSYEEGFVPPLRHGHGRLALKAILLEGKDRDLAAFKQVVAQNQGALAIVSFAGAPTGVETLFSAGPAKGPLFYVFDSDGTTHWLAALKDGRFKAVVVPRPGVDAHGRERISGMPEAIFDDFYLLATPANADEVAASLKTQN